MVAVVVTKVRAVAAVVALVDVDCQHQAWRGGFCRFVPRSA